MKAAFLLAVLIFPLATAEASFTLSIAEPDRHFFSGEEVERTIIIKGNSLRGAEAALKWETLVPPAVIQRGKKEIDLKPSSENRFKICLKMPEVKRRAELIWKSQVFIKGKGNLKYETRYSIFPKDIPRNVRNILSKKVIGIMDPRGDIGEILGSLDIPFTHLNSRLALKTFQGDLVIVGPHTSSSVYLPNALLPLKENVNEGLSVLYFEQACPHPFLSPMRGIVSEPVPFSSARIAAFGHPAFQEIMESDLSNWRGNGLIAYFPYRLPRGNFRALVRTDLPDHVASPLLEVLYGQGKFIFCQLLVIEKFREEPVARLLFENLIRYAFMEQKSLQPAVIYGEPESEMMKLLDSAGVCNSDKSSNIIICADKELALLKDRAFQQHLKQFVWQGNTLIIFGFSSENAGFFNEMVPGIAWSDCISTPIAVDKKNPVLWGITESDIKQMPGVKDFFILNKSNKIKTIIKPGIMVKVHYGKGQIILCRIQFGETDLYILSQLLTNLGIKIKEDDR